MITALFFMSELALANNCTDVIKLSVEKSEIVQSEESFKKEAANFCKEYSKNTASGKSGSLNVGYGGFTLGASSAKTSANSIADKLCKSSNSSELHDNAYRNYIKTVAPAAYSSYDKCINSSTPLQIGLIGGTEKQASIKVSFNSDSVGRSGGIIVDTDNSIKCSWKNSSITSDKQLPLGNGESKILKCSRSESSKAGYIAIIDEKSADKNDKSLSLPWSAYEKGVPVSLIYSYNEAIKNFEELNKSFSGAVATFNRKDCPAGWDEVSKEWQGRYIVLSNDNQGSGELVGESLSDNENRSTGEHKHTGSIAFYGGNCKEGKCADWGGGIARQPVSTNKTLPSKKGFTVSEGTNAPYVSLIGCIKKGI